MEIAVNAECHISMYVLPTTSHRLSAYVHSGTHRDEGEEEENSGLPAHNNHFIFTSVQQRSQVKYCFLVQVRKYPPKDFGIFGCNLDYDLKANISIVRRDQTRSDSRVKREKYPNINHLSPWFESVTPDCPPVFFLLYVHFNVDSAAKAASWRLWRRRRHWNVTICAQVFPAR